MDELHQVLDIILIIISLLLFLGVGIWRVLKAFVDLGRLKRLLTNIQSRLENVGNNVAALGAQHTGTNTGGRYGSSCSLKFNEIIRENVLKRPRLGKALEACEANRRAMLLLFLVCLGYCRSQCKSAYPSYRCLVDFGTTMLL